MLLSAERGLHGAYLDVLCANSLICKKNDVKTRRYIINKEGLSDTWKFENSEAKE